MFLFLLDALLPFESVSLIKLKYRYINNDRSATVSHSPIGVHSLPIFTCINSYRAKYIYLPKPNAWVYYKKKKPKVYAGTVEFTRATKKFPNLS